MGLWVFFAFAYESSPKMYIGASPWYFDAFLWGIGGADWNVWGAWKNKISEFYYVRDRREMTLLGIVLNLAESGGDSGMQMRGVIDHNLFFHLICLKNE